jgi:hypothetical protein
MAINLIGTFDWTLVAISYTVSVLGAFIGLVLAGMMTDPTRWHEPVPANRLCHRIRGWGDLVHAFYRNASLSSAFNDLLRCGAYGWLHASSDRYDRGRSVDGRFAAEAEIRPADRCGYPHGAWRGLHALPGYAGHAHGGSNAPQPIDGSGVGGHCHHRVNSGVVDRVHGTSSVAKVRQRLYHRGSGVRHALQRNVWSKLHRSGKAGSRAGSEYLGFRLRLDHIYQRYGRHDHVHQRVPRGHSGIIQRFANYHRTRTWVVVDYIGE